MGNVVAILNQKGGVGKTTVTLGLAAAASAARHRVLVVDLDPQGSATWVLGLEPGEIEISAAEVLGRTPADRAIVPSGWSEFVDVLPASPRLQARETGNPTRLHAALAAVSPGYDAVLIDCPPSLGNLTASGLAAADRAIIVVEPSALGLRGITAVADVIDEVWDAHNQRLELSGVIVNKVPAVSSESDRRLDELTRIVGKKAVWHPAVPQRVIVNQAIGDRQPVHAYGSRSTEVSEAFDALWAKLRRLIRRSS